MAHSRAFRGLFFGSFGVTIVAVLAVTAGLLFWRWWLWHHIPNFSQLNETEIESYVRDRILSSHRLEATVSSFRTEAADGPDIVRSEHIITDTERIRQLAKQFRVLSKWDRIGPCACACWISIRCDREFGISMHHGDVLLPIPKDEWGSYRVQVPMSFLDELGDLLDARPLTDDWKIRTLLSQLEEPEQAEQAAKDLGTIGSDAVYYLDYMLQDKNADVEARLWAAIALRDMGPNASEAVSTLAKIVNDTDETTRLAECAREPIKRIDINATDRRGRK